MSGEVENLDFLNEGVDQLQGRGIPTSKEVPWIPSSSSGLELLPLAPRCTHDKVLNVLQSSFDLVLRLCRVELLR